MKTLVIILLLASRAAAQIVTTDYVAIQDFNKESKNYYESMSVIEFTPHYIEVAGPHHSDKWVFFAKNKKVVLARNPLGELAVISSYTTKKVFLLRIATGTKYYDFYVVQNPKEKRKSLRSNRRSKAGEGVQEPRG